MKYVRNCPTCNKEILYTTKGGLTMANKRMSDCRKCASYKTGFTDRYSTKGKNTGNDNGFYGKKHTEEAKKKIGEQDRLHAQTTEFKQKMSSLNSGKKNPMHGRTVKDIWIEKYGPEEANTREAERKKKISKANSGKNNSMYGKPSPKGSGVGWKGWYKGYFFRSLRELCYIIYLEENNISWISGESVSIEYKFNGNDRTYKPDFIINNEIIVEIKPEKLHNTPNVLAKKYAAEKYCRKNHLKYQMIDMEINLDKIILYKKDIKFLDKYEEKINEAINNHAYVARHRKNDTSTQT